MRRAIIFAFLMVPALSFAEGPFECVNPPKAAVIDLPEPVDQWANIICTPHGHVLTNRSGWAFVSKATRQRTNFPAQITSGPRQEVEHGFYFVSVELKKLEGTSAIITDLYLQKMFQDMGEDIPSEKPVTYDLTLVNNKGTKVAVFFYVFKDTILGTSCWESCIPVKGFDVLKKPKDTEDAVVQVPLDKMPEFIATGAVTTFNEICLKIYTDYPKAKKWMSEHSSQENTSKSADTYREQKTDRVFLVGSSLASYIVTFAESNYCTIFSAPADKKTVDRLLEEMMSGYASRWKTKFEQTQNESDGGKHTVAYAANIPGTDKPILALLVNYMSIKDEINPLVTITGVSLKRMQTSDQR